MILSTNGRGLPTSKYFIWPLDFVKFDTQYFKCEYFVLIKKWSKRCEKWVLVQIFIIKTQDYVLFPIVVKLKIKEYLTVLCTWRTGMLFAHQFFLVEANYSGVIVKNNEVCEKVCASNLKHGFGFILFIYNIVCFSYYFLLILSNCKSRSI